MSNSLRACDHKEYPSEIRAIVIGHVEIKFACFGLHVTNYYEELCSPSASILLFDACQIFCL